FQTDLHAVVDAGDCSAVEGDQVSATEISSADSDVEYFAVVTQGGGGVHDDLGDRRVGGRVAGGDPRAIAGGVDAGDAALQVSWIGASHQEAEINIAGAIRGDGRVDEDRVVER